MPEKQQYYVIPYDHNCQMGGHDKCAYNDMPLDKVKDFCACPHHGRLERLDAKRDVVIRERKERERATFATKVHNDDHDEQEQAARAEGAEAEEGAAGVSA